MIRATPFLLLLMLDIFCVIDIIQSRDDDVRNLPKTAWLLLVLIFTPIGAIAWLVAGRPTNGPGRRSATAPAAAPYPEYDRPGRATGVSAESDENFLRQVRERAEEQRRRYAEQQRAAREKESEQGPDPAP